MTSSAVQERGPVDTATAAPSSSAAGVVEGWHRALGLGVGVFLFYGLFLSQLHRVIIPFLILFFLVWWRLRIESGTGRGRSLAVLAMLTYIGLVLEVGRMIAPSQGTTAAITFERLTALFPLAAMVGWQLVAQGRFRQYCRMLLLVALITVLPAIYEYTANVSLLNANHAYYVRGGHTRAVVGADHPLVLGTLFLGLMPIAMFALDRYQRLACIALFIGVLTTGSNGPEGIGVAMLAVCLLPQVARIVLRTRVALTWLFVAIFGYIAVGSAFYWGPQLQGANTTSVSNEYRAALYYLLPHLIAARPFGYGLGGIPPQTWFFSSSVSGLLDVSVTVDSEVVYAAAQFGVIALGLYLLFCITGVRAAVRHHAIGLSSLAVTLAGFFLALHAWESLGSFWLLMLGAGGCVVWGRGESREWRGLFRERPEPNLSARSASADRTRGAVRPEVSPRTVGDAPPPWIGSHRAGLLEHRVISELNTTPILGDL